MCERKCEVNVHFGDWHSHFLSGKSHSFLLWKRFDQEEFEYLSRLVNLSMKLEGWDVMKLDWWLGLNLIQANPISISEVKCYNNRKTQTPPPGPEPHFIMSFLLEKQRIIIDIYFLGDTAFTVDIVVKFVFNNAITILFWFYCNLLKRNKLYHVTSNKSRGKHCITKSPLFVSLYHHGPWYRASERKENIWWK